ncbi:MAG: hypothetical protein WCQ82_03435 [Bacteroidaceae bacterium]|nr:hypothetical protein [Bacteroidaceae bacterium]
MRLIVESSSTRTEWCLVEGTHVVVHAVTEGINPFFQTRREISRCIRLQLPSVFFKKKAEIIYFYGAGCTNPEKRNIIEASLVAQFRAPVAAFSDLLGAARGLFGDEPGIACILGTGSNSCYYDGSVIKRNVKSLGYVLGDEGSGAILGKMFLGDCLKNIAPKELADAYYESCQLSPDEMMSAVYNSPFPNRFLSKQSFFLKDYMDHPYVHQLLYNNFKSFFERCLFQYDYKDKPIRFVGSVAFTFAEVLKEVAIDEGVLIDVILDNSMAGIVDFHTQDCRLL